MISRPKKAWDYEMTGEPVELYAVADESGDMTRYQRLIGDEMNGNTLTVHPAGCRRERLAHRRARA